MKMFLAYLRNKMTINRTEMDKIFIGFSNLIYSINISTQSKYINLFISVALYFIIKFSCVRRELNELRKPSSDNPEILRFFRYMKAAKDGQDGEECLAHGGCPGLSAQQPSPAMLTTFNDINKLVQARKLNK